MNEIILSGIQADELVAKILKAIKSELRDNTLQTLPESPSKFLSRIEVTRLLKISLPTLHQWTKLGLLQSYKIGNRVLYKHEEIEKALLQVTNIKSKR